MTRGLFRTFLIIIIVSVVGSIFAVALILNALQASPVLSKLERQERDIVLDLAEAILVADGVQAADQFAARSEAAVSLDLAVQALPGDADCGAAGGPDVRLVAMGTDCYQLSVRPPDHQVPFRLTPILLGLSILASSVLAAGLLARNVLRPILILRDGLSALAQGQFDTRVAPDLACRKDEIATLAADFDRTAARLQTHRETQRRLFHDVSHELRSPLSRLQAVAGILRKSPAKLSDMLDRIDREVERLDTLVGEVLILARLNASAEDAPQTQRLDLIEILNNILSDAAFEAEARRVTVTTELEGQFLADVDGELIYRAMENVVRNATKHTAEGTEVTVECHAVSDRLRLRVTDRGPGVAPDELDRIFQAFSRGSDAVPRGGHGLGLAITKRAIESHGGYVTAELPDKGGLAITLEIPRHPDWSGSTLVSHAVGAT